MYQYLKYIVCILVQYFYYETDFFYPVIKYFLILFLICSLKNFFNWIFPIEHETFICFNMFLLGGTAYFLKERVFSKHFFPIVKKNVQKYVSRFSFLFDAVLNKNIYIYIRITFYIYVVSLLQVILVQPTVSEIILLGRTCHGFNNDTMKFTRK